eukprot:4625488-Pyramimonas_sp.AAC.1
MDVQPRMWNPPPTSHAAHRYSPQPAAASAAGHQHQTQAKPFVQQPPRTTAAGARAATSVLGKVPFRMGGDVSRLNLWRCTPQRRIRYVLTRTICGR